MGWILPLSYYSTEQSIFTDFFTDIFILAFPSGVNIKPSSNLRSLLRISEALPFEEELLPFEDELLKNCLRWRRLLEG